MGQLVIQVYEVSWFEIKRDNIFYNQQLYIFKMIQRVKQRIEKQKLQQNVFALLLENILLSMLKSDE